MKICYFGIYDPEFGRNKVYMDGLLANGHEVIECRDASGGLLKFFRLWRRHSAILRSGGYDALVVGYPGHMVVPFAKMLSRKIVVFDALCSLHEGEVISRGKYRLNPFMRAWLNFIDMAAVKAADVTLVETEAQRAYFLNRFNLDARKVFRVFTGADEGTFHPNPSVVKRPVFTAVFRGKFLPEAGVSHIVRAAKILEGKGVDFLIIGNGHLAREVEMDIQSSSSSNLDWISGHLPKEELVKIVLECQISLGQFEDHERLERTIPHKAFEALAMGMPYVTGRTGGISELLTDGKDCIMVRCADPGDLAEKILKLKDEPALLKMIASNGAALFADKFTPKKLAVNLVNAILARKTSLRT